MFDVHDVCLFVWFFVGLLGMSWWVGRLWVGRGSGLWMGGGEIERIFI